MRNIQGKLDVFITSAHFATITQKIQPRQMFTIMLIENGASLTKRSYSDAIYAITPPLRNVWLFGT